MEWANFICETCIHQKGYIFGCAAFPDGKPDRIVYTNKHNRPYRGQKNKIVYTPIKPELKAGQP